MLQQHISSRKTISRLSFLQQSLTLPVAFLIAACAGSASNTGEYPGRTRHIHVKVQAPGQPVLTTQLYFPGESRNTSDSIFSPELLMQVQSTSNGQMATFNFVLALQ